MTASGIPIVRYRSPERLYEIMAAFEACGVMIANPHVVTLEDGSRYKRVDADQLGFKHEVDPMGLLNPGKMRSFVPQAALSRNMTAAVPIKAMAEPTPIKTAASGARQRPLLRLDRHRQDIRNGTTALAGIDLTIFPANSSACSARPVAENRHCSSSSPGWPRHRQA